MKAYLTLLVLVATSVYAQNAGVRQCRPTEVVYLLDHSENAKKASTINNSNEFELLKTAWNRHMGDFMAQIDGDRNIRVWAWAYSSRQEPIELVQRNTPPSQALNPPIGNFTHGGSWTYRGMEALSRRNAIPSQPNNLVVIISAQGSFNPERRELTSDQYDTLHPRGWNFYVIGVMSGSEIDRDELSRAQGKSASLLTVLDDGQPTNKKSYRLLGDSLFSIVQQFCPPTGVVTQPPVTRPPPVFTQPPVIFTQPPVIVTRPPVIVTRPPVIFTRPPVVVTRPPPVPSSGICSNCLIDGGYGFDRHPVFCDSFYRCLPDSKPIKMNCGQGLVWNSDVTTCVAPESYVCPVGACDQFTPENTRYPSGLCCNAYLVCRTENGIKALRLEMCPQNEVFQANTGQCVYTADPRRACTDNSHYCNHQIDFNVTTCVAAGFTADTTGNPCVYFHDSRRQTVPTGTVWDQTKCRLVRSDNCDNLIINRDLPTSDTCQAVLLSTFNDREFTTTSPRTAGKIFINNFNVMPQVGQGFAVFRPRQPPAGQLGPSPTPSAVYYYYFSDNEPTAGSAFRIVFRLANNARDETVYDLLSNNFCGECPQTIGVTVRRISQTNMVITSSFVDKSSGMVIQAPVQVNNVQQNGWIEYVVIWGARDVHGEARVLNEQRSVINRVSIPAVPHTPNGSIQPNKCGLLLGQGQNQNFMGAIDVFAYYTRCANIEDALNDTTF